MTLNAFDLDAPPALRADDILVLTVKTQDVKAATTFWAWRPVEGGSIASSLPIITLQNGLASEVIALRRFANVYAASLLTPARYTQTGIVSVAAEPEAASITIGRFPHGVDDTVRGIVADFASANYIAEARDDIQRWKAAKLAYNVRNVVELFDGTPEQLARFGDQLAEEAKAVLTAAGHDLASPTERRVSIDHWRIIHQEGEPKGGQSTWQSFIRGSSSEVDFLNGEIVRLGRLHNVQTPINTAAQIAAARLASGHQKPGAIAVDAVLQLTAQVRADHR